MQYQKDCAKRWKKRKSLLPNLLSLEEWQGELQTFENKCALSDSADVTMDHFIPISTGHGGTYIGNVFPLDRNLNCAKNNENTIEWAEEMVAKGVISKEKWDALLELKASQNGMNVSEFKDFVNWCHGHPRQLGSFTVSDRIESIDLFKQNVYKYHYEFALLIA